MREAMKARGETVLCTVKFDSVVSISASCGSGPVSSVTSVVGTCILSWFIFPMLLTLSSETLQLALQSPYL